MSEREEGFLKNWITDKGYGFVRRETGQDLFVHISALGFIIPKPGDRLSFDVGTNPKNGKPEAKNVAIMGNAA
jgi:cold shock CspA family protein